MLRVASIDVGLHNLAIVIEDFDSEALKRIPSISASKKFNNNLEPTDEYKKILEKVFMEGKIAYLERKDIIEIKKKFADDEVLINLSRYLASLEILKSCSIFVIERQMNTKMIKNSIALRIQDHIHSYLIDHFGDTITVVIFNSSNKTKVLGAPKYINGKKMTKYQRKKWAEDQADKILKMREDYLNHDIIFNMGYKSDDLSDALIQLQSFKYKQYCGNKCVKIKWDAESVSKYIEEKEGKWLDSEFESSGQILNIRCSKGHEFKYRISQLYRHWCGECYRSNYCKTLEDVQNTAKEYDGKCLSAEYINSKTIMEFECKFGHIFWRTRDEVSSKKLWCKECGYKSLGEEICRFHFEKIFKTLFKMSRPKWLKNSRKNLMEIDGYSDELKIGFEYSGRQHYRFIEYFHKTLDKFQERLDDDIKKKEICEEKGILLLEIPYTVPFSHLKDFIINIINQSSRQDLKTLVDKDVEIDYLSLKILDQHVLRLQEIQEIVSGLGGECLSKSYISAKTPMIFVCQHDEVFESTTDSIKQKIKVKQCWCKCKANQKKKFKTKNIIDISENEGKEENMEGKCSYVLNKNKVNTRVCKTKITVKSQSKIYCTKHCKYDLSVKKEEEDDDDE